MMKKLIFSVFLILIFIGCDEEQVDGNRPPMINRIDISHSLESGINRYVVNTDATDPDNDNITYSFDTSSNITILASTSTALINIPQSTGTPPDIIIKVIAEDDKGGIATREFNLRTGNKAPVILFYEADKYKLSKGENTKLHALVGDDDGSGDTYSTTFRISSAITSGILNVTTNNQSLPRASYTGSQSNSENATIELEAIDTDNNLKASSFLTLEVGTGLVHVDSWDTSPIQPYGLDFSSNGHLFITSIGSTVMELDTNGNKVNGNGWNVTDPSSTHLRALTVDKRTQNEVLFLGSDRGTHEFIIKYSKTGSAQTDNKTTFPGIPHYYFIRPNGTILISNNKPSSYGINILNTNGTIQSWTSAGQLSQPRQISLDPNTNNVYVADRGNGRVRVFDSSGSFIRNITGNSGQFSNPHGVLADRVHNSVFVADTENDRIQEFAFDGTFKAEFRSNDVNKPRYIIRGPDNRIYVASYIDKEIHVFEHR